MRIEGLEHPGDGAVDQPIGLHFADEIRLDRTQRGRKHLMLFGNLVLGDQRTDRKTPEQCEDDGKDRGRKSSVAAHILRNYKRLP